MTETVTVPIEALRNCGCPSDGRWTIGDCTDAGTCGCSIALKQRIDASAQGAPDLGDFVSIKKGTPYFYDWRGVEMKIVSLCIDPEGKRWASVIDKSDPKNTRHRGFGVYDGETTDFELDHLERTSAPPSTKSGGGQ